MAGEDRSEAQLIEEAEGLRRRVADLETAAIAHQRAEETLRRRNWELERLYQEADRLRAFHENIVQSMEEGIVLEDAMGYITFVNPKTADLLGYAPEELVGCHYREIVAPEGLEKAEEETAKRPLGVVSQYENVLLTKDGQQVTVLTSARPLFEEASGEESAIPGQTGEAPGQDGKRQMSGVLSVFVDITERKRAEEEIRRRTTQLESLRQVGLELSSQMELDALLHSIVARAAELLGGTEGGLYLYRPDRDVLEWTVSIGPHMVPTGTVLGRGEGLAGKVWENGQPMVVDDYRAWDGRAAKHEGYSWTSVAGVPVRWGDEFLGVLNVVAEAPGAFSMKDAKLLDLFASHAAIALRNAHLLQREQRQHELVAALADAAAVVSSTLDLDQVLDRILEQVERAVAGEAFNILLLEAGVARPVRWRGYQQFGMEGVISTHTHRIAEVHSFRQMMESGESVVIADTATWPDWVVVPGMEWLRAYIAAPIRVGAETVGFLNVDSSRPGQFDAEDARRLEAFANHAATAIENARLYEQARRDAETKTTLLSEVNHRVKNNLSAIVGLLYLEQSHAAWQDEVDCAEIMEDLAVRIQGLATVHSMLTAAEWMPLRLSDLMERIIHAALRTLPREKSVSVDVAPSSVLVTPDQAHDLALVINELTTNAVKHAWSSRTTGRITARAALEADTVVLELRDDGMGHPEDILHPDGRDGHSVGLYLVRSMVEKGLHGELALHNDGGAVTTIRFKNEAV